MEYIDVSGVRKGFTAIVYVDPDGVDATDAGTAVKPFRSLAYAVKKSDNGTAIVIKGVHDITYINLGRKQLYFIGDVLKWQTELRAKGNMFGYLDNCSFYNMILRQTETSNWVEMFLYGFGTNTFHNCIVQDKSRYSNVHNYDFIFYNCIIENFGDCRYAQTRFYRCLMIDTSTYAATWHRCIDGTSYGYDDKTYKIFKKSSDATCKLQPIGIHCDTISTTSYMGSNLKEDNTTAWLSDKISNTVMAIFDGSVKVTKYAISGDNDKTTDRSPSAWTFEASYDMVHWKVLDQQSDQYWESRDTKYYDISNRNYYKYYRLKITANGGHDSQTAFTYFGLYSDDEGYEQFLNSVHGVYGGLYSWNSFEMLRVVDLTGGPRQTSTKSDARTRYTSRNGMSLTSSTTSYSSSATYMMAFLFDGVSVSSNYREYYLTRSNSTHVIDVSRLTDDTPILGMRLFPVSRWRSDGITDFGISVSRDGGTTYENYLTEDTISKYGLRMTGEYWSASTDLHMQFYGDHKYFELDPDVTHVKLAYIKRSSYACMNEIQLVYRSSPLRVEVDTINSVIHKNDVSVRYVIDKATDDEITGGYYIAVNGVKVSPFDGLHRVDNIFPVEKAYIIPWKNFKIGTNQLSLVYVEGDREINCITADVDRINDAPKIQLQVSSDAVHLQDLVLYAEITDTEREKIAMRLYKTRESQEIFMETAQSSDNRMTISPISLNVDGYTIESEFISPINVNTTSDWATLCRGSAYNHPIIVNTVSQHLGVYDDYTSIFYSCGFDMSKLSEGKHLISAVAHDEVTDFYIDASYVGTALFRSRTDVKWIGNYNKGQAWGKLRDFRIWHVARTEAEILSTQFNELMEPYPESLVAYYKLREDYTDSIRLDKGVGSGAEFCDVKVGNPLKLYPQSYEWTPWQQSPLYINFVVCNKDLEYGTERLTIEAKDENGYITRESFNVTKYNNPPAIINPSVKGNTLYAMLDDIDGDYIGFKIKVGDKQVYPRDAAWTKLAKPPMDLVFTLDRKDLEIDDMNMITLAAIDSVGEVTTWTQDTFIDYVGLMFTDADENYYSNDFGEVIKYLEMGTVLAGESSDIFEVFVKNNTGFDIENIQLWVDNETLDEPDEKVKICSIKAPFTPCDSIKLVGTLAYREKRVFYVRLDTSRKAIGQGKFDIYISGDPQ